MLSVNELSKEERYEKTKEYWNKCENTVEDMLGGNPQVNGIDVKTSSELLEGLIKTKMLRPGRVIDCGAGIGRITNSVLQNYFMECDLLEMNENFVNYAKDFFSQNEKIKDLYCSSLQDFKFLKKYDCIWIQWCIENLEDDDLDTFLSNCYANLEDDGLVIIKENVIDKGIFFSQEDYSKVRSDLIFKEIFLKNGFKIVKHFHHPNWPKDLLKVSIFVLKKN